MSIAQEPAERQATCSLCGASAPFVEWRFVCQCGRHFTTDVCITGSDPPSCFLPGEEWAREANIEARERNHPEMLRTREDQDADKDSRIKVRPRGVRLEP